MPLSRYVVALACIPCTAYIFDFLLVEHGGEPVDVDWLEEALESDLQIPYNIEEALESDLQIPYNSKEALESDLFEQHCQYCTVFLWNNPPYNCKYVIKKKMWRQGACPFF